MIGAPSSVGAYGPGQERTPQVFRTYGLIDTLTERGIEVVDGGDGHTEHWRPDDENPTAANVESVAAVAEELAAAVSVAFDHGHNVLVLGGDCTVELGTVAGAIQDGASVGLAYIDLDADLNTPETGDGVLDWMGVAHVLDIAGAHPGLAGLGVCRPMLPLDAVRLFATNSISDPERKVIERLQLSVEPLDAVLDDLTAVMARTREWAKSFDRLVVHVDADVLSYDAFPIAENTRRVRGLDLSGLTGLLSELCGLANFRGLTLCEINPGHAPDERDAFAQMIAMVGQVLAPRPRR